MEADWARPVPLSGLAEPWPDQTGWGLKAGVLGHGDDLGALVCPNCSWEHWAEVRRLESGPVIACWADGEIEIDPQALRTVMFDRPAFLRRLAGALAVDGPNLREIEPALLWRLGDVQDSSAAAPVYFARGLHRPAHRDAIVRRLARLARARVVLTSSRPAPAEPIVGDFLAIDLEDVVSLEDGGLVADRGRLLALLRGGTGRRRRARDVSAFRQAAETLHRRRLQRGEALQAVAREAEAVKRLLADWPDGERASARTIEDWIRAAHRDAWSDASPASGDNGD